MPEYILGLSAFYHDSAAVLLRDGEILFAAQEERFSRIKHDPSFPARAAAAALACAAVTEGRPFGVNDLAAAVFYEKPLLKLERILDTCYAAAPGGLGQFIAFATSWAGGKLDMKGLIRKELSNLPGGARLPLLLFTEHHLSHAASAFYPSPFKEAAVLTVDGVGEWATASVCRGRGNELEALKELRFPHSPGLLYSAFTLYTGFKVNSGEYKMMGLAPYGTAGSDRVNKFKKIITSELADIKADGSLWLNMEYFDFLAGPRMTRDASWERLFGVPPREPESGLKQEYCDLALAAQQVTEDILLKMAAHAKELTGSGNLCLAGGVALNCTANGRLKASGLFEKIWIQPAAGDAGGALGAALAARHLHFGRPRAEAAGDMMKGALLGPEYSDAEIETAAARLGAVWSRLPDEELFRKTAEGLAAGLVTGWFQGRAEWGPRALGGRSILADPRDQDMQKKVNLKIKKREGFRPFAPSVRAEEAGEYFEESGASPYMLATGHVKASLRLPLPEGCGALPPMERLSCRRSALPAITHLDWSARLQTVEAAVSPRFHRLLGEFKELTGCGVLLNTSFNVRGEPIVLTPEDAYRCFMATGLDRLVMGNCLFEKSAQPRGIE